MDLWQIRYTSIVSGQRETYMDVGFETPQLAKDEIRRLMRDAKKLKKSNLDIDVLLKLGMRVPTPAIGRYWRVKKVKCKPI